MFVILSYDVDETRVARVAKIVRKYLSPVQRSLYQGHLSENQLYRLKNDLLSRLDPDHDRIVIYKLDSTHPLLVDTIGDGNDPFQFIL